MKPETHSELVNTRVGRWKLILLAAIFLGPLAASFGLYYATDWRPSGQVHHGHLLATARPMPELTLTNLSGEPASSVLFRGHWTMLYVGGTGCDQVCAKTLYNARQVHTALGKEAHRVVGVYLATDRRDVEGLKQLLDKDHRGIGLWFAEGNAQTTLTQSLTELGAPPSQHSLYVIDPLGNWVMYYTPDDPPKGWLKDLKKLLRLSRIG